MSAWQKLVAMYADGRPICNCGGAYYSPCGVGIVPNGDGTWTERTDLLACQYGCSANQHAAKADIAARILKEKENA